MHVKLLLTSERHIIQTPDTKSPNIVAILGPIFLSDHLRGKRVIILSTMLQFYALLQ